MLRKIFCLALVAVCLAAPSPPNPEDNEEQGIYGKASHPRPRRYLVGPHDHEHGFGGYGHGGHGHGALGAVAAPASQSFSKSSASSSSVSGSGAVYG